MQRIRFLYLRPEHVVGIATGMVRELHIFGAEAGLTKGTCLLHQRVALSVNVEASGERGMLLTERVDIGVLRLDEAINRGNVWFKEFCTSFAGSLQPIMHIYGLPFERIFEELVLQSAVVAHEETATLLEVVKQEVGLARLEHRADETALPVHEELRCVQDRNFYAEASLFV